MPLLISSPAHYALKVLNTKHFRHHFIVAVNTYINDTVKDLAAKAARGENIANSGTFLAFLVAQDKLTYEEIIGNLAEIVPAAVDTVRGREGV